MLHARIGELVADQEYPATTGDLIDAHGDRSLELQNGSETVGEALAHLPEERFDSPEEARDTLYAAVSGKAIGRPGYSDRDPTPPGSREGPEPVSF
ncbi:DUF2795 domain-containing protein [Saliphagus sp. LR7]|uniref:DUF5789 family protein n=1 Tax=Saliphagus sp. LR7 TaxID=2282654 RepID=UPI000DF77DD7|nr:DUF2795 domain-containing protein [Saliphagus sp. LR7]